MAHPTEYLTSVSRYISPSRSSGQRTVAAALSIALVLAAILPGVAFAGEVDSEGEGSAPPDAVSEAGEGPEFDPGGETTLEELPAAVGAPLGGDAEDTGEGPPVEAEPAQDAEAPPPSPVEATVGAPEESLEGDRPALQKPVGEQTGAPEPEPAPVPSPASPVENRQLVAPPGPPAERQEPSEPSITVVSTEDPPPVVPPIDGEAPPPRPVATAVERGSGGSLEGRDSHTVTPGESLWSIAEALLPARTDNAEIAREVQRLWRLNESRIGTGDPDMLPVGVVLRLR